METARLVVARAWDGAAVDAGERVVVAVAVDDAAMVIEVDAPFFGDAPPPHPPGPTPALWSHEVVELFVLGPGDRYTEVELGPGGHHLVLQLAGRRQVVASALPIAFSAVVEGGRWRGRAVLDAGLLPPRPWRVNAYAIHGAGAARAYRAAFAVPGAAPDFHRLDCFTAWDVVQSPQ
ncbi:MAG: hypothetical protein R3F65_05055 [bacterium]